MRKLFLSLCISLLLTVQVFGAAFFLPSPFTPPNVSGAVCGIDSTTAIQAALNSAAANNGFVSLPPCPQTNPLIISATLSIPSNTTLCGVGMGITWLKQANSANLAPIIINSGGAGAPAATQVNNNITLCRLSIDGNSSNQSAGTTTKHCAYFNGTAFLIARELEFTACPGRGLFIDGNGAKIGPAYVDTIWAHDTNFMGVSIDHAQRRTSISNILTENTTDVGIFIDASEGSYTNLRAVGAGNGATCTSASTRVVDNPGGGGASQTNWNPCPAGIWLRNITGGMLTNVVADQNNYYGVLLTGVRATSINGMFCTQNSLNNGGAVGTWDDCHLDLTNNLPGYGEHHKLVISGLATGTNYQTNLSAQMGPPTARYGLFIADGLAGSMGEAVIAGAGTGYLFQDILSGSGGTSTEVFQVQVQARSGTTITSLYSYTNAGSGVYTVLPANPVALTGGAGTGATANVTWSTGSITGVTFGPAVTAHGRYPAFTGNWRIETTDGNIGDTPKVLSYQPGLATSITNTKSGFTQFKQSRAVESIYGSANAFTCIANPVVTLYDCGNDATCASPVTVGSVTITASGQAFTGTLSNPNITLGDYVAWATSAGTCTSIDLNATAQVR